MRMIWFSRDSDGVGNWLKKAMKQSNRWIIRAYRYFLNCYFHVLPPGSGLGYQTQGHSNWMIQSPSNNMVSKDESKMFCAFLLQQSQETLGSVCNCCASASHPLTWRCFPWLRLTALCLLAKSRVNKSPLSNFLKMKLRREIILLNQE